MSPNGTSKEDHLPPHQNEDPLLQATADDKDAKAAVPGGGDEASYHFEEPMPFVLYKPSEQATPFSNWFACCMPKQQQLKQPPKSSSRAAVEAAAARKNRDLQLQHEETMRARDEQQKQMNAVSLATAAQRGIPPFNPASLKQPPKQQASNEETKDDNTKVTVDKKNDSTTTNSACNKQEETKVIADDSSADDEDDAVVVNSRELVSYSSLVAGNQEERDHGNFFFMLWHYFVAVLLFRWVAFLIEPRSSYFEPKRLTAEAAEPEELQDETDFPSLTVTVSSSSCSSSASSSKDAAAADSGFVEHEEEEIGDLVVVHSVPVKTW